MCSYGYVSVCGCALKPRVCFLCGFAWAAMGMCLYVGVHCSHGYAFVCRCAYPAMGMCLCAGVHTQLREHVCVLVHVQKCVEEGSEPHMLVLGHHPLYF